MRSDVSHLTDRQLLKLINNHRIQKRPCPLHVTAEALSRGLYL